MSRIWKRTLLLGIVAASAALGCIRLGVWQLDRLAQRRARNALLRERALRGTESVQTLRGVDTSRTHWRHVTLRGVANYGAEMVQSNRSQRGAPGAYLLTPVMPVDPAWGDTAVLVIRGYVYAADGHTVDYVAARERDTLELQTLVTAFAPPARGGVSLPSDRRAVNTLDRDSLSAAMHIPLAPFVLLALGESVTRDVGRPARVTPPSLSEGSHRSYAVQWFSFAAVAIVGFVAYVVSTRTTTRR